MMLKQIVSHATPDPILLMAQLVCNASLEPFPTRLEVLHVNNVLLLDPILNLELLPVQSPSLPLVKRDMLIIVVVLLVIVISALSVIMVAPVHHSVL
jgi:hypothetical protein